MLGGGKFTLQNKILPGSYINFVSSDTGINVFGERGVVALGCLLDWGSNEIMGITKEDFINNSKKLLGYDFNHYKLKDIREVFKNARKLYLYKINSTSSVKASCAYCTAVNYGSRGNAIKVIIRANADNKAKKDVFLYMDNTKIFNQTVASAAELSNDNGYVNWNKNSDLAVTAGTFLTGGADGEISGGSVTTFLNLLESYSFNAIGIVYDDSDYEDVLIEYTKRMRDEVGKKFQCVTASSNGDYEGNVIVNCNIADDDNYHIISWVVGAIGSCPVNKSLTNTPYNGEYNLITSNSRTFLETYIKGGEFLFHQVNGQVRVLLDINSLVTTTSEKGEDFKDNQTVRVCDQIAADVAEIFNNYYLGKVPNDNAGRNSLWNDIVKHHEKLRNIRAIEDFDEKDIIVNMGDNKKSVVITDNIMPVNAMAQLYMTISIN